MLEDIELRIKVRVDSNSPEAFVLKYLNSKNTLYPKKDMVLISLISYWLPMTSKSEEEHSKNIKSCLYRLTLHQQYLEDVMPADGDKDKEKEDEPEKQHVRKAKSEKPDYFTTIEESKNISDSNTDVSSWVNPLKTK